MKHSILSVRRLFVICWGLISLYCRVLGETAFGSALSRLEERRRRRRGDRRGVWVSVWLFQAICESLSSNDHTSHSADLVQIITANSLSKHCFSRLTYLNNYQMVRFETLMAPGGGWLLWSLPVISISQFCHIYWSSSTYTRRTGSSFINTDYHWLNVPLRKYFVILGFSQALTIGSEFRILPHGFPSNICLLWSYLRAVKKLQSCCLSVISHQKPLLLFHQPPVCLDGITSLRNAWCCLSEVYWVALSIHDYIK